jgi:hypothetical protein
MGGRRKKRQGKKGKQTPENTPKKNKVDDAISDISENEPYLYFNDLAFV